MTFIAAVLYLPHHVTLLAGRAWYYIKGEHINVTAALPPSAISEAIVTPTVEAIVAAVEKEL
jgi:hypothetical protein